MINEDFSLVLPYTNVQLNQWEAEFLTTINFEVHVDGLLFGEASLFKFS